MKLRKGPQIDRAFGNIELRRIFGLKREEGTRGWRKLQNEVLHDMHSSRNIIRMIISRKMRWTNMKHALEMINSYRILVGRPDGKRSLERHRQRSADNI
jgi:hypothetical protein